MTEFLGRRFARRDNLDVEGEVHARERRIAIEQHLVALDRGNRHDRGKPVRPGLKLIADLQFALDGQQERLSEMVFLFAPHFVQLRHG